MMQDVTLVGIDLGKHSFHLHGQDRRGNAVFRKKLGRKPLIEFFATFHSCTVVMEACAGSHYMARKFAAFGHQVKLISPQFVRPFVKSNKNDFVDAEAICEAASRPAMRFVTPKTESQQTLSALHRVRESLVRDRTKTVNQMHGFLLEFGISLPVGKAVIARLTAVLAEHSLPPRLVMILERLHAHFKYLDEQVTEVDKEMTRQLADDDLGQRLLTIPGVGPVTASVLAAEMGDAGANLIVARGAILTTTPNRFTQANNLIENQCCKNGGDHRFSEGVPITLIPSRLPGASRPTRSWPASNGFMCGFVRPRE
jgi:transposase